jgi:hypothetical protein
MLKNGPARCIDGIRTFSPNTPEFKIHILKEGIPICGFQSKFKFIEMQIPLHKIPDWKKCPKCTRLKERLQDNGKDKLCHNKN